MPVNHSERLSIIVDTREQHPFEFDPVRVETIRMALSAGDYSLAGFEPMVSVERKSLEDYISSVIKSQQRFLREVEKLAAMPYKCVVVEGDLVDIQQHRYHSGVHPSAVLGATMMLLVDFGVPVLFCSNRQIACAVTEAFLLRAWKRLTKEPA
ncbi:MAG: hypothetical protein OEM52_02860 [bacterium]|nr:hypothetical protein [bacterium]